jgi:hypothetical protein
MVIACMQNITEIKVDGYSKVGIQCDPMELVCFISGNFMHMNLICEQAEMSEVQIYQRSKVVFEYFGLPFNAEPPP